jgi:predicted ribosomally synthesized peptide with SipW-like signal peptide
MRTSIKIRALLALGALSGVVWAGTFAAFSDSGTADATFSAGTVDLMINGTGSGAYSFTSLSTSNMKPTDVVYAPLTIKNNGSLNFTYGMTTSTGSTTTTSLADALTVGVRAVAATCDASNFNASTDTLVADGTALASGTFSSRSLSASGSEILCFKVAFPSTGSDNTYQGADTQVTFSFSATQA